MQRLKFIIIGLLLAITFPASAAKENPFNVDVFFGWNGHYRPSEWTPVNIEVSSQLKENFNASVLVSAKQDGLNTMNIHRQFVLMPSIPQHIQLASKFAFNAEKCTVKLIDVTRGRVAWQETFNLWDYSNQSRKLITVHENDMLIGLIGKRSFGLTKLPQKTQCSFTGSRKNINSQGSVYIGDKLPTKAPWDWTGFSSLDLLILYAPDWSQFRTEQLTAICQWVSKGGKLLLIPGPTPIAEDNPIASLLPYRILDARQVTLTSGDLKRLQLNSSEPETVVYRPIFTDGQSPLYKVTNTEGGECLFVSGNAGFGSVGILALDPAELSDKQKNNASQFWVNCITMMLESKSSDYKAKPKPAASNKNQNQNRNRSFNNINASSLSMSATRTIELTNNAGPTSNNNYFQTGLSQAGSNAVMEYLYNISEMRPLGIWPVIFLLLLLAILVGPVDYIVLKRKGILPMTWVTSAFWIILFSVGAYHGVQALRGGTLQMRHVTILDGIQSPADSISTASDVWSTNYSAIFAPSSDDYVVDDERQKQWFSAISPAERQIYSYNSQGGSKQIHCEQDEGSNKPYSMPINIWTMQCLINEAPAQQMPINATFTRNGRDVTVKIDNYSSAELKSGYILFDNDKYLEFSAVPPTGTKEFTGKLRSGKKWNLTVQEINNTPRNSSRRFVERKLETEKIFSAMGSLRRTRSISNYLAGGAAVVCATFEDSPVPYRLKNKKPCEYKHIQLVRLVIFPEHKNKDLAYDQN